MLRDKALIPLSHQHQHALALCVFVERALRDNPSPEVLRHWEGEVARMFADEVRYHFACEEQLIFPAADAHRELRELTGALRAEHAILRTDVAAAAEHRLGADGLSELARVLGAHVRKEERELFEAMQRLLAPEELARIGAAVDEYFRTSGMPPQSCGLPFNSFAGGAEEGE